MSVEAAIFGTSDRAAIDAAMRAFVRQHLAATVAASRFYAASVGVAQGFVLDDGRSVVVKARTPADANPDLRLGPRELADIDLCMRRLHSEGFPCPAPLVPPRPLALGFATVESFVDGARGDGFAPACRAAIADALAEIVARLAPVRQRVCLRAFRPPSHRLFPHPHSAIFDFTAPRGEWIDAHARRARSVLDAREWPIALGHCDFRVEHLRFDPDNANRITAVYDWDSLSVRAEVDIVGCAAHGFPCDWSREAPRSVPTADEARAFVADYERARGRGFSRDERQAAEASCLYWTAYRARCAHSLDQAATAAGQDARTMADLSRGLP